ncbi:MAG: S8 family serine peptidase, partial [Oscillospiraceae bacterium]|nr:S8 family serine peptidase [Oscillospiraceae bacterium]
MKRNGVVKFMNGRIRRCVGLTLIVCMLLASFPITFAYNSADSGCEWRYGNAEVARLIADNWCDGFVGEIILTIGDPYMQIDGISYPVDPIGGLLPIIKNDEILLPVSALIEETGGHLEVDAMSQNIKIEYDRVFELTADEYYICIDGELQHDLDIAPLIVDDTVLLSICTLESNFGFEVYLDSDEQQITLRRDFQTRRLILKTYADVDMLNLGVTATAMFSEYIFLLQFETMYETQAAYMQLSELDTVIWVESDLFLPTPIVPDSFDLEAFSDGPSTWNVDRVGTAAYAGFVRSLNRTDPIVVAVLDTGVDVHHPIFQFEDENGNTGTRIVDPWCIVTVGGGTNVTDSGIHGTFVAGVVAANTPELNNVKIMPIRMSRDGSTMSYVAHGINTAVARGADVINTSFTPPPGNNYSPIVNIVTNDALNSGVVVVGIAGNEGVCIDFRTNAHLGVIRVSATNSFNAPSTFSNFSSSGRLVHIAAPGEDIRSSIPSGGYTFWDGTSFVAPHVAAAVAMYMLVNPGLTPARIHANMMTYVNIPVGWQRRFGTGILDMRRAIAAPIPTVSFHFYGINSRNQVRVPVEFGRALNMARVTSAMEQLETIYNIDSRFAHWGWFTDNALNVSGRYSTASNIRAGLRRPVVGTSGFDTNRIITREMFERYAQDGEIHLHSVWSLWGDVDDNGRVDIDDIDSMRRNILGLVPRLPMNRAPGDV